jgi:hypothetical protein
MYRWPTGEISFSLRPSSRPMVSIPSATGYVSCMEPREQIYGLNLLFWS